MLPSGVTSSSAAQPYVSLAGADPACDERAPLLQPPPPSPPSSSEHLPAPLHHHRHRHRHPHPAHDAASLAPSTSDQYPTTTPFNAPARASHAGNNTNDTNNTDNAANDSESAAPTAPTGTATAANRWQQTATRVLQQTRVTRRLGASIRDALERHQPGAAPGIDPRRSKYLHLAARWCLPVQVTVVDYDAKEVSIRCGLCSAEALAEVLQRPRPPSARVRWIHVDGLNWEVIQLLALTYDLHPLALEDTVHVPQRIKADLYDSCLYMALIYLYLANGTADETDEADYSGDDADAAAAAAAAAAAGTATAAAQTRALPRTISAVRRANTAAAAAAAATAGGGNGDGGNGSSLLDLEGNGDGGASLTFSSGQQPRRGGPPDSLASSIKPGPAHYPLPLHHGSVTVSPSTTALAEAGDAAAAATATSGGGDSSTSHRSWFPSWLRPSSQPSPHASGHPHTRRQQQQQQQQQQPAASSSVAASAGGGSGGGRPIHVSAQQVSLFLLRGDAAAGGCPGASPPANTLISVFQSDGSAVTEPILAQLREPRTLVREAEDASFLANLVIDTLVDHIFPVVGAYREMLQGYEAHVMAGGLPSAAATRELHAMQRDLRRIDRTIAPLQAVVANVVARDATIGDTAAASALSGSGGSFNSRWRAPPAPSPAPAATETTAAGAGAGSDPGPPHSTAASAALAAATAAAAAAASAASASAAPSPLLSRLTRTYLGDVRDHVATICEDLISLSAECGDLIGLIFNLATHQQSQSTQTLAVVSTIFLPITFLAGVYGMNFDNLPELHWSHGYLYFWLTSAAIVLLFIWVMLRARLWSL